MVKQDILSIVKKFAVDKTVKDNIHGFSHVIRVLNLCLDIGKKLGANLHVLEIAALLHDIGRESEEQDIYNRNHAELSAEMSLEFIKSQSFQISQNKLDNIIHCIRAHSFSNKTIPKTLEAKILSDVDKLDALGAIGLYRVIGFTIKKQGGIEQVIEHLENKILKLKDRLYLDSSKKIAEDREVIIRDFYKKILKKG
ncbi:MAG: HD domain-containing protein [Promethearchaeota archaeon]